MRFAMAPAKFVYHVWVCTIAASIGSATMFMLNERTWRALMILGSPVARPRRVDWYRRTFTPSISGGAPISRVRTSTLMSFANAIVMYFAWTPAPPYIAGGYSHV